MVKSTFTIGVPVPLTQCKSQQIQMKRTAQTVAFRASLFLSRWSQSQNPYQPPPPPPSLQPQHFNGLVASRFGCEKNTLLLKALILLKMTKKLDWVGMECGEENLHPPQPHPAGQIMIRVRSRTSKKSKWREGTYVYSDSIGL